MKDVARECEVSFSTVSKALRTNRTHDIGFVLRRDISVAGYDGIMLTSLFI